MMKVRSVLKAPVHSMLECSVNFEVRVQWDIKITDFKTYAMAPDYSSGRVGYNFISPMKAFVADRDFYIQQYVRRNWPNPGDIAIMDKSLPLHPECPLI